MNLMNCKFSKVNYSDILNAIKASITDKRPIRIIYANTKTVNLCIKNSEFQNKINAFEIVHPDGIGVKIASDILQKKENRFERFNWTDHANNFLKECESNGWSLFFIGSTTEVQKNAKEKLSINYPNLKIVGQLNGFDNLRTNSNEAICDMISNSQADIVWVGLGTPLQEEWIYENRHNLKDISVIQSVGDIFRFLAEEKPRGSKFIQKIGLEWFVRLINEPHKYWKRTIIGIPLFLFNIFRFKLMSKNQ
ncbi:WecB/TagA/CpsF family glycosyltransferase [Marivirga sp. S37H4]|uniref:WecB/TagA/CpsF family glycosyltransferase n=1 Tax=Marivirga aurantiaca TaxID=2802615 RepID=A0A934X232_9BACT|nr:WecB/TagA/CpsF family glycosyltransferase [Marivirga aurantiaca]MBK6267062.1 WecB/TagA/CpsF family glycosyltransferase [Marivirga aurantiaca]